MITPKNLVERGLGIARGVGGQAGRVGGRVASDAAGQVQRLRHLRPAPKDLDDVTLARKVESIVFRDAGAPKGKVDVNVANGRVQLRGEVKNAAQIEALVARVRAIPEVQGVDNFLHQPKSPAPTRASTPRRQQKPKASTQRKRSTTRKTTTKVSDDKTTKVVGDAEPTGEQLAQEQKGRQPAPLGEGEAESGSSDKPSTPGQRVEQALQEGSSGNQSDSAAASIAGGNGGEPTGS